MLINIRCNRSDRNTMWHKLEKDLNMMLFPLLNSLPLSLLISDSNTCYYEEVRNSERTQQHSWLKLFDILNFILITQAQTLPVHMNFHINAVTKLILIHTYYHTHLLCCVSATAPTTYHRINSLSWTKKVHTLAQYGGESRELRTLTNAKHVVQCSSCTCGDVWVYNKGVVGWVDASLLVVLLAEGEGAAIHANIVHVCVASHCGLW